MKSDLKEKIRKSICRTGKEISGSDGLERESQEINLLDELENS